MRLVLLLTLLWAWALAQSPSGQLTVALANDPKSLFMPRAADRTASNVAVQIYNTLVAVNDQGQIVPELATRWSISPDGKEYTFTLRSGVRFHNGEEFNAQSVVATWESGQDKSNDYAGNYSLVKEVRVQNPTTVTLVLDKPNALFLNILANFWALVPPAYIKQVGLDGFAARPVGTGPFRFVSRSADRIVLEANPSYWERGLPKVQRVVFRVIPDATTRVAAVRTGEIDIANRLTPDLVAQLQGNNRVRVVSYPNDRVYYLAFKNVEAGKGTPLENRQVRQALNLAINRPGIVKAIFNNQARLVAGFVLPGNLGYDEGLKPYPYDPEQAKKLLAAAGFEKGFSISMGCPTDAYVNINEVCLSIQRDLAKVGVDVSLEFKTSTAYWSKPRYGAVGAMYVDSWSSTVGEALPRLQGALTPGAYYNTWEDEELAKLIEQIGATTDRAARAALYRQLQKRMYDDPPFVYLYQPVIFEAVSARVQDYRPRSAEEYFLKSVSVR
ncbi:MAG: ABC transporter substrate-binding protein [Meiothermus sp.]|uniref:ABC transporter substrate-binding protein n=1 Tax=Meiothermus sp. TaxID=1955249 RepID=UPI0025FC81DA|nr:ABC transporter substrate-binding protein [Meiothermus sp.]MCS7069115.1 ABC transporter substrate-binding protein [Meiothermus sp.]MCX7740486.1 ABC transporter substrate-binding protein [Meiothermus sp.]MDW8425283.1 ABC transporter substrate-binding protein [Meiothermus sp.]